MVYVTQEAPGRNLTPARQYGELNVMLPPGNLVLSPAPTIKRLRKSLNTFSKEDYLLLMGDPVGMSLAFTIASEKTNGFVKVLKWDRQHETYLPITLNLNERYE
jgi:hypothetical protein